MGLPGPDGLLLMYYGTMYYGTVSFEEPADVVAETVFGLLRVGRRRDVARLSLAKMLAVRRPRRLRP